MRDHPLPSSLTQKQLRAKAEQCRVMAGTSGDAVTHVQLLRLSKRFDALANARQRSSSDGLIEIKASHASMK